MANRCSRCGGGPVMFQKGNEGICEKCGTQEAQKLQSACQGGKVLEFSAERRPPADMDVIVDPNFAKGIKPQPQVVDIVDVEVIFKESNGRQRSVQLTESEGMSIANRIIENRRHGKKEYRVADVVVVPVVELQAMVSVLKRLAGTSAWRGLLHNFLGFRQLAKEAMGLIGGKAGPKS